MLREVNQRLSYMPRVLSGVELEDVRRLFITPSNNDNCSGSQPVPLGRSLRAEEEGYIRLPSTRQSAYENLTPNHQPRA